MECTFVYGFLWARLQTGGWETVTQVQTPTLSNPPSLQLFQHPPAFLLPTKQQIVQQLSLFYSLRLCEHSAATHQRQRFSLYGAMLVSITGVDSIILGLLISSGGFSLIFQAHAVLGVFDRFLWPQGQHFYVMLLPPRESAYARVKFLMQECSVGSLFCACVALLCVAALA